MKNLVTKETIGTNLGVSLATVNNWIKTRFIPLPDYQNYYSEASYNHIINKLKNETHRLNFRANRSLQRKKEICYLGITDKNRKKMLDDIIDDFEKSGLSVDNGVLALSLSILRFNKLIDINRMERSKIDTLFSTWLENSEDPEKVKQLYSKYKIPSLDDNILGAFYQSIQSISQKSRTGLYYTPSELLQEITVRSDKTILDPCCGSGGILLNVISKKHDPSKIFARDVDETALKICFTNLALFFHDCNLSADISKRDITENNVNTLFTEESNEQFDYIITNPPWGSKFPQKQKDNFFAHYPELETSEIFSISLYNSLKMLKKDGRLFFFLPYSFLNVAAHKNIRNYVISMDSEINIKLLGNAFKGVLSEAILISIKKNVHNDYLNIQNRAGESWELPKKNIIPPEYFISATSNREDISAVDKIYSNEHIKLPDDTIFALGLVTGNNKKYLLNSKTKDTEVIFRGKDVEKYRFSNPEYFIKFQPESFQQTAPVEYYRQKKIAYRFICDKLVCVLDNDNALLLNSANLFISKNYPMETIVSFFNSDIYTFIFRKKFHSKKVLKSHLQNLPLPVLSSDTHQYIFELYGKTFTNREVDIAYFQKIIDEIICNAFNIDQNIYNHIKGEI